MQTPVALDLKQMTFFSLHVNLPRPKYRVQPVHSNRLRRRQCISRAFAVFSSTSGSYNDPTI